MNRNRIIIIDELRGIAVILMIIYHTLYSLEFIFNYNLGFNLLTNKITIALQLIIGCLFVFISGVSSGLAKNPLKNGIKLALVSAMITLVTKIFIPSEQIIFGVLHFLSVMMIVVGIWRYGKEKFIVKHRINRRIIPEILLGEILAILFIACYNIRGILSFENGNIITSILGFPSKSFYSADYYPIIPWAFLFLSGYNLKKIFNSEKLRNFSILGEGGILSFLGNNSLKIYLVHQPIIIFLIFIAKKMF